VKKLYYVSVTGYIPFELRKNNLDEDCRGLFSSNAIAKVRSNILNFVVPKKGLSGPTKIYIRRSGDIRKLVNQSEIESLLRDKGFSIIDPDDLSFVDQVKLFSSATDIVTPAGAALANIIFCKPNVQITILAIDYIGASYWYWQGVAWASGNVARFCLGSPREGVGHVRHSDFHVPPEYLLDAL